MQHWLIDDHYQFGWVTFAIMMVPVLFFGRWLERHAPPAAPAAPPPSWSSVLPPPHRVPVAAAMLLLVLPAAAWAGMRQLDTVSAPPELPVAVDGWQLDGVARPDWRPLQPGHSVELNGRYTDGAREVDAWVVYYARQVAGRKLIGYGNAMARPGDGRLQSSPERPGELRLLNGRGHGRLIWYRYEVNGRVSTSAMRAKLDELMGNFRGRPSAYAVFFSAPCRQADCAEAREALDAFEHAMAGQLPGMGLQ
jgi:EpsI family protein